MTQREEFEAWVKQNPDAYPAYDKWSTGQPFRTDLATWHAFRAGAEWKSQTQTAQMSGWLPIKSAPKDGTDVIVMYMNLETQIVHNAFWLDHEDGPELSGWWSYDKSESSRVLLDDFMTPTNYMPLPPAPSADTSQKEES